jgi:hypothetical protein
LTTGRVLLPVTCTSAIFSLFDTLPPLCSFQQIEAFKAGGTRG